MEKEVDNALSTLHQRVNGVKGSLQVFMRKLEMGGVLWPDVNENFSTLAGQLNFLQKVLTKEETPELQNLVVLPLMTSQVSFTSLFQLYISISPCPTSSSNIIAFERRLLLLNLGHYKQYHCFWF